MVSSCFQIIFTKQRFLKLYLTFLNSNCHYSYMTSFFHQIYLNFDFYFKLFYYFLNLLLYFISFRPFFYLLHLIIFLIFNNNYQKFCLICLFNLAYFYFNSYSYVLNVLLALQHFSANFKQDTFYL